MVPAHAESKVTTEQVGEILAALLLPSLLLFTRVISPNFKSSVVTKFFGPQPMVPINTEESKLPLQILDLSFKVEMAFCADFITLICYLERSSVLTCHVKSSCAIFSS